MLTIPLYVLWEGDLKQTLMGECAGLFSIVTLSVTHSIILYLSIKLKWFHSG